MKASSWLVFIGTLTVDVPHFEAKGGEGIHVVRMDQETGQLSPLSLIRGIENPNYLAFDAKQRILYAASEVMDWPEGRVTSFAFDEATGTLTRLNSQSSLGNLTCFLSLTHDGRHLLAANYSMLSPGSAPDRAFTVLPVKQGRIAPASSGLSRTGQGPNTMRQERPHAHCIVMLPDGRVAGTDLGTDRVLIHGFDSATGMLSEQPVETIAIPPGSGPRHIAVSDDGARLFVINEMGCNVSVLTKEPEGYKLRGSFPILPDGEQSGESYAAAIVLSPCGRFLYASNRKPDYISLLHVASDGGLSLGGAWPSGGRTPRSVALTPDGRFLLVGNQDSGTISVFRTDPQSGAPIWTVDHTLEAPMCVTIA